MGQTMSRMQLTWLGQPGAITRTRQTFLVVAILVFSFFVYCTALEIAAMPYEMGQEPTFIPALKFAGNLLFTVWAVYALCRTRQNVRARFQIPEENCKGCEDCCCAFWCGCCVAAQMLRHTGEYETYPGTCLSATGHPPGTPLVV
jgi:Cys-rich protein (TIGR01571 family)